MARIRSVKPEFWEDQELAEQVSRDARLMYIGLWNLADEHGRLRGDPRFIEGRLFPYDDDIGQEEVAVMLDELAVAGRIVVYRAATGVYLFLPKLAKNQRLEPDKVPSRLPGPDDVGSVLLTPKATVGPDECEFRADESAPDADESVLLYGSGSMEHVSPSSDEGEGVEELPDLPPPRPSTAPTRKWSNADIDNDPHFAAFWNAYPRKTDKGNARNAWLKALRSGTPPSRITEAAQRFRADPKRSRDIRYVAHPTTWLNGERYSDYPDLDQTPPSDRPFWEN